MSRFGRKNLAPQSTSTSPGYQNIQSMLSKEKEKIEPPQKSLQEQIALLNETIIKNHEEIRDRFAESKLDTEKMSLQLEEIKQQNELQLQMITKNEQRIKTLEERSEEYGKKLEELMGENSKLEATIQELEGETAMLQLDKANYYLRFWNLEEESKEQLKEKMIHILAESLEVEPEEIRGETDEVYRLNSTYAKKNKIPREVQVKFTKKATRDEILKCTRDKPLVYNGRTIDILKQIPKRIRDIRKQFHFLTNKLIDKGIIFRWLNPEGILINWNNTRHYLNTVWKAKEFEERYRTLLGEEDTLEQYKERTDQEIPQKNVQGEKLQTSKDDDREQRITRSMRSRQDNNDRK